MSTREHTIAFIGAGNMATALIKGLLTRAYPCELVWASDKDADRLDRLKTECGIHTTLDNREALSHADIVVLAVKPQVIREVLMPLQQELTTKQPLLISIAAGISIGSLQKFTADALPIVRCMPNTPALVQAGVSALFANQACSEEHRAAASSILQAVGAVCWLEDESAMDAVTALSGSGPAYVFLFIEAMREAAVGEGLDPETANMLALQTVFGAGKLALESQDDVTVLRQKVTSPGGTTAAALAQFEKDGFNTIIARAIKEARARSQELARLAD